MRRLPALLVLVALIGCSSSAADRQAVARPTVLASWRGSIQGVTQDESGAVAWCRSRNDRSDEIVVVPSKGASARSSRLSDQLYCGPTDWPELRWSYVLAKGTVAWGGYEEVRCSDTHWALYEFDRSHGRRVALVSHNCSGFGTNFRGLVSDGTDVFYGTVRYGGFDEKCDLDNICTFRLSGGGVYRLAAGRSVRLAGFSPTAEIAASNGRIATVEANIGGTEDTVNGPIYLPAAALNGRVEVRRAHDAALISSFRPAGIVRALALSKRYAIVLIRRAGLWIDWYDANSGARLGSHQLPGAATPRISASDRAVVFVVGKTIHALDLPGGRDHQLWRGAGEPLSLSISGTRLVWAEYGGKSVRVLTLALP